MSYFLCWLYITQLVGELFELVRKVVFISNANKNPFYKKILLWKDKMNKNKNILNLAVLASIALSSYGIAAEKVDLKKREGQSALAEQQLFSKEDNNQFKMLQQREMQMVIVELKCSSIIKASLFLVNQLL